MASTPAFRLTLPSTIPPILHHHHPLRPSLRPFSVTAAATVPTSFPYSSFSQPRKPAKPQQQQRHDEEDEELVPIFAGDDGDDERVIGDCLVFEEGAFEGGDPFVYPKPVGKPSRRKASRASAEVESECLIPDKWKETAAQLSLTKKEKRKIAHELKFGSKLERRLKSPLPDMEEYLAFKEMKMAKLKPVVLDNPDSFPPEEKVVDPPEPEGRVAPRNPRSWLGGGSFEDISDFFNSEDYVPGEMMDDEKKPKGEFYLLDALLKHNVDINAADKDGLTAIHKAIIGKKQAIMNYLLRESANPFVRDQDGWTPLHLAVQTKRTDIVRLLLIKGADKTLRNRDGLTPLDLCLYSGRDKRTYELIKLLKVFPKSKSLS
ncbi:Ankyrin repeat-containing domain-containing protein [Dioscorea alata]|uniref:Ankyrin repeat-containing domain-containing protein n=4 Tax=Dioscorea alata TaxID=55571 RepID=A0ACB7WNK5_DIOAL|nr:Ankyrin repeat-containing domain-containing protein [Dioscorea alata]KAH7690109.1 Ankyrin repeat-containing domain-containing protein [Dioscorea alata]KAH7690119.1 Ankyrin repeat-containing domain-containing protein [Dioscorea alata]KAH7690121.1 Ankyrin repeat-containing domain-containing protein [Dioscorea alata]